MEAEDIIKQLRIFLPSTTDLFGDTISITALSASGTTVTATSVGHGVAVNDYITVVGAEVPVPISSLSQTEGVGALTTSASHDVTKSDLENYVPIVRIEGADQSEYNKTYEISSQNMVPSRTELKFLSIDASAISPATGTILLFDGKQRGYNGRVKVTEVVDEDTFKYESSVDLTDFPSAYGTIKASKNIRISGAVSYDVALEAYTKKSDGEFWAFVVLDDVEISKDRRIESDAISQFSGVEEYRQRLIFPFTVYVFAPTSAELSSRKARDMMQSEVFIALSRSILGKKFDAPTAECTWSSVTMRRHGFSAFEKAYYVHEFEFEQMAEVTYNDTIGINEHVAFRDICGDFDLNQLDEDIDITFEVNLDDETN